MSIAMTIIYEPREDSELLAKHVAKIAKGKVLDIGTGSGIQAVAASKSKKVVSVLGVDIQEGVISYCNSNIKNKKISFKQSDLFSNVKGKFDTITFNPPYLPEDIRVKDLTLDGGKKGYEILERFFYSVNNFLVEKGEILVLFSSLTNKDKIHEFISSNLLDFEELDKLHISFEDLYVYRIWKSDLLKELEFKKVSEIHYSGKGQRGFIYRGRYKGKTIVIKSENPNSTANAKLENEVNWLKKLNKKKIGPKLIFYGKDYVVMDFIKGPFIREYIERENKKTEIKKILLEVFDQMKIMDEMNVDKEEMHHPFKHVIINNGKPVLLDFERCKYVQEPRNVTQFCQYINSLSTLLNEKKFSINKNEIINMARKYKKTYSKKDFEEIKKLIK